MDEPQTPELLTELLLVACELATRVECRPQRDDGSDAAIYESSGPTLARRIRAGAKFVASYSPESVEPGPARFHWDIAMQVGAARRTRYKVWLDASPEEVNALWRTRKEAKALRDSLPHSQRKKKPWGLL
ncbi:MAG: hypothetical protein ACAH21_17060 [Ramlibacter sp.]|nr:hypothetical protein [Ramlibacter sp.]